MPEEVYHIPALLEPTLSALDIRPEGRYIDATLGGGGHTRAIVERLDVDAGGHLWSFDQDEDAIARAPQDARLTVVYSNFRFMRNFMRYHGVDSVDGILADLGVSFHHFDDAERGFSFRADGPLDMRMNRHGRLTAADVVNTYSAEALADVLRLYGEVKTARRMAETLVKARADEPITTTARLAQVVAPLINPRQEKKELAQVFQALRIEVNGEIDALREMLEQALTLLRPGGRLAILTYHSLEDRLVKNFIRTGNIAGRQEKDFFGRSLSPIEPLWTKPVVADEAEVAANPRSRSAKLRVGVKTAESTQ